MNIKDTIKLGTSLYIERNEDDEYDIVFKIGSFPTKGLAGQYAVELAAMKDEFLSSEPDALNIEKETMH